MAGGTGGHIYPGLAVADELRKRGWQIAWLGTQDGMESKIVPEHGYPIYFLKIFGLRGKSLKKNIIFPFFFFISLCQSIKILFQLKPNVVLSMGGYVAFPGAAIAAIKNIPVVVHEQNSVAGLTNRLLSKIASKTLVAFPEALPNSIHTGNPVRETIEFDDDVESRLKKRIGPLRILVVGGSLGADILNKVVPESLGLIALTERPKVIHQSGSHKLSQLLDRYARFQVRAECVEFISNMGEMYREVDLIICRAGAMTIAEIAVVGVASILIPFPHAVDDHQKKNALFLVNSGAALLIEQENLSPELLSNTLKKIDRKKVLEMSLKARSNCVLGSASIVADICEQENKREA